MKHSLAFSAVVLLLFVFAGARSQDAENKQIPGAVPITIGSPVRFDGGVHSSPIIVDGREVTIVKIGQGTFSLDNDSHLIATFNAGVSHCTQTNCWAYAAVFDRTGKLLGTAALEITVSNIRLPVFPTIIHELKFDFGNSRKFVDASQVVMCIGER